MICDAHDVAKRGGSSMWVPESAVAAVDELGIEQDRIQIPCAGGRKENAAIQANQFVLERIANKKGNQTRTAAAI